MLTWKSDLELWIKLEHVEDSKIIFYVCVLTSIGETRKVIQELMDDNDKDDDSDDDDDNYKDIDDEDEDDDNEEDKEIDKKNKAYPSLNRIVKAIEEFYGIREDQNNLLRELRALRIKRNERIKDFNIKYKTLYLKLNKKKRSQISVLDYTDSIENTVEAWKRLTLFDNIFLSKAFKIAEKQIG